MRPLVVPIVRLNISSVLEKHDKTCTGNFIDVSFSYFKRKEYENNICIQESRGARFLPSMNCQEMTWKQREKSKCSGKYNKLLQRLHIYEEFLIKHPGGLQEMYSILYIQQGKL